MHNFDSISILGVDIFFYSKQRLKVNQSFLQLLPYYVVLEVLTF